MYKYNNTSNKNNNNVILKPNKNNIEKQISSGKASKDYEAIRDIVLNNQETKKKEDNS